MKTMHRPPRITDAEIEEAAIAIYNTHRRRPAPAWEQASEEIRDWVREQAMSCLSRFLEIRSEAALASTGPPTRPVLSTAHPEQTTVRARQGR
jgi:hypothetical protein